MPGADSEVIYSVALLLLAVWKFPIWGRRMLALKRDWDAYRRERD